MEPLPAMCLNDFIKDAFIDRHTNIRKVMVPAWLFPCFHAEALIMDPHVETLKARLDGLDVLITVKVHPREASRTQIG